jgi:hypothetical protein
MFYRRRLPHWHPDLTDGTFRFVTWRLAGSIPQARLPEPHKGAPLSAGRAFLVLDREADISFFAARAAATSPPIHRKMVVWMTSWSSFGALPIASPDPRSVFRNQRSASRHRRSSDPVPLPFLEPLNLMLLPLDLPLQFFSAGRMRVRVPTPGLHASRLRADRLSHSSRLK